MPPIRVLQIMPAMDAGGMETFVMNVYRAVDRSQVQFDFLYHYDKPCFYDAEIEALGGHITKLTVRQDNNIPKYLHDLRAFFTAHPEYKVIQTNWAAKIHPWRGTARPYPCAPRQKLPGRSG